MTFLKISIGPSVRFVALCISVFLLTQTLSKNQVVLAQSQGAQNEEDEETLRRQGISGREGSLFGPDNSDAQSVTQGGASTLKFHKAEEKTADDDLNAIPEGGVHK